MNHPDQPLRLATVTTKVVATVYLANTGRLSHYVSAYRDVPFADTLGHFVCGLCCVMRTYIR